MAKTMGFGGNEDLGDFKSISFIKPNEKGKPHPLIARSKDYTVVMHFNDAMRDRLILHTGGIVNSAAIDAVYHIDHENNWVRKQQKLNLPKELENLQPGQTFTIKRRNQFGGLDLEFV